MEKFLETLITSGDRLDDQRVVVSPTHHILPVDTTDSGHSSLENTAILPLASHSASNSYSEDFQHQAKQLMEKHPQIKLLQRIRSRSEENVFQSVEERNVDIDDLRTSSEAMLLHKRDTSYSSDARSDVTLDSLNISHGSVGLGDTPPVTQDHHPDQQTETSVDPVAYQNDLKRRTSISVLYSATLGFCGNLEKKKVSYPALSNGRIQHKISVPVMVEWEEDVVEM